MTCDTCGHELEVGEYPYCPHGRVKPKPSTGNGFPFTTSHITGEPITIESETHLKALCAAHGVTHRPDVAWLEKRHIGSDRNGNPVYKEGSGMGLPGVWF